MPTHLKQTLPILAVLALLLPACTKDGLTKKEKKELFAAPTAAETEAIRAEWAARDLTHTDYAVLHEVPIQGGAYTFKMLGYRAGGIQQYGALLIPQTATPLPVRVWVGGFDLGTTLYSSVLEPSGPGVGGSPHILAIPALRGQALQVTVEGTTYTSPQSGGEHCNAFDGGTDDVLALLNLIQQTEPMADVNRSSVRGGSRGGTVALLAGIRDPRVKRVVCVVGPTDMLTLTMGHTTDDTYRCQFLDALQNGQITLGEARKLLIASSPLYFAQYLPPTQLHMGLNDTQVPIDQAYALEGEMLRLGLSSQFQLFMYDKGHSDIATDNPEMAQRVEEFLSQL